MPPRMPSLSCSVLASKGRSPELPGAVNDLRAGLDIDAALPLGIFGFSQGGAAALLALSQHLLPFKAAVTFGAVMDLTALMDALAASFGVAYEWTDERRALATQLSSTHRARALAAGGAALLLGVGAGDPYPTRDPAERLADAIRGEGGMVEVKTVPQLEHAFVDGPGDAPAPQGQPARAVDELASGWFGRYLK